MDRYCTPSTGKHERQDVKYFSSNNYRNGKHIRAVMLRVYQHRATAEITRLPLKINLGVGTLRSLEMIGYAKRFYHAVTITQLIRCSNSETVS